MLICAPGTVSMRATKTWQETMWKMRRLPRRGWRTSDLPVQPLGIEGMNA